MNVLISLLPSTVSTVHNRVDLTQSIGTTGDEEKFMHPDGSRRSQVDGALRTRCGRFFTGVSFARKYVKLYTDFYKSDIIIASPVALAVAMGPDAIRA